MDKKYYDVIISLIKEHKKYPGCESILDDIAEDVYSRSEVVINSVANEDVILSYFQKMVSTSIVSVSRKLNIKTRANKISIEEISTPNVTLNNLDEKVVQDEEIENLLNAEELEITNDVCIEENLSDKIDENTEDVIEEAVVSDINEVDLELEEKQEDIDKSLVEKMINGVAPSEIEEANEEVSLEDEIFEELEMEESVLVAEFDNELSIDMPETNIVIESEESAIDADKDEESVELETEDSLEVMEDEVSLDLQEPSLDLEEAENEEGFFELDTFEQNEDIEENSELEPIEENEQVELNIEQETENQTEFEVLDEETTDSNFIQPKYDCFAYTPELPEYDCAEIFSDLEEINSKYPEKHILEICDMKFNKRLTISEIAKEFEITEDDVINVLNEIIETVKD